MLQIIIVIMGLLIMSGIGIFTTRRGTEDDFFVCGRRLGAFTLGGSMAAGVVGGGVLLVYSEYAYNFGLSAFTIFLGLAVGLIALLFIAPRYKEEADKQQLYTLPDLFSLKWGRMSGLLASLVVVLWAFGFVVMQLIAASILLRELIPELSSSVCVIIAAVVTLSYLIVGGLRSVVITDVIQYLVLVIFFAAVGLFSLFRTDLSGAVQGATSLSMSDAAGFFILGALNVVVSADLWQRVYAAKSARSARAGLAGGAIGILIVGVVLTLPILHARASNVNVPANLSLIYGLRSIVPGAIISFIYLAVLCAVLSTLDTMIFVLGMSISNDIRTRFLGRPVAGRLLSAKVWMVVVAFVGALLAIIFPSLLTVGLALSSLGLCLVPAIIGNIFWKLRRETVIAGLVCGLAALAAILFAGRLSPTYAVVTLPVAILGSVVCAIVGKCRYK